MATQAEDPGGAAEDEVCVDHVIVIDPSELNQQVVAQLMFACLCLLAIPC